MDVVINAIIESLLIGLGFFYKALWPILLGVLITAAIETFVNEEKMAEILGGRGVRSTEGFRRGSEYDPDGRRTTSGARA